MMIFNLTIRQLLSGKRWMVLIVLAAFPALLSFIDVMASPETVFLQEIFPTIVPGMVVPITALLLAGSIMASDMEEGTAVFVLAKPVSRLRILLERFLAAAIMAIVLSMVSSTVSILIQSGRAENLQSLTLAYGVAVSFGALLYSALFMALSLVTRRGIIIGLLYVLVWESALAGQFAGTRSLSMKEYMLTIASNLDKSGLAQHTSTVLPTTAVTMGLTIMTLALLFSLMKLRNYEMKEQG